MLVRPTGATEAVPEFLTVGIAYTAFPAGSVKGGGFDLQPQKNN
jgi:hypothetical protein